MDHKQFRVLILHCFLMEKNTVQAKKCFEEKKLNNTWTVEKSLFILLRHCFGRISGGFSGSEVGCGGAREVAEGKTDETRPSEPGPRGRSAKDRAANSIADRRLSSFGWYVKFFGGSRRGFRPHETNVRS
ncbi:hypothetical protein GWI33_005875 [Rhynchophorus ferrugineus]|uniref:Mos1 transposase HTH domain-containing protein n=1 Tax=Rhynchophorus ferrugineus TaxID=354439 RepID=A0A834IVC4_RHYFE|nr:hypothetical protein GWI33_005875 [Rhynchophorus ferrugineus]